MYVIIDYKIRIYLQQKYNTTKMEIRLNFKHKYSYMLCVLVLYKNVLYMHYSSETHCLRIIFFNKL